MKSICSFLSLALVSLSAWAGGADRHDGSSRQSQNPALPQLGAVDDYVGNWNKRTHVFRLTDTLGISKTKGGLPYKGTALQYKMGENNTVWIGSLKGPGTDGHRMPILMWEYHF